MSAYAQIRVRGTDAMSFLQGQLTNDLEQIGADAVQFAAWCNPKGRVIAFLRVSRDGDAFRLALPAALGETVVERLLRFRFRAKVELVLEAVENVALGLSDGAGGADAGWLRRNLLAGIPDIGPGQSEKFTPHMLNLDRLDALSLDKGCYTGQEIVARTHYRGATKRRMLRFRSNAPVAAGDAVSSGDRRIGEVVNAIGLDLLAVVPVDGAGDALSAGGALLTRESLPYALD